MKRIAVTYLVLLILAILAAKAKSADYLTELSNRVAAIQAQPGFVKPGPAQTFSPLVDSITAASETHEPVIEAPSRAAEAWLSYSYSTNRWRGVKWYLETPRGWLLPVDQLRGVAPGMTLHLTGLLPNGYPLPPLPDPLPEYAPFAQKPVVVLAVRGWASDDAKGNPVTSEAMRLYASPQTALVTRLGRWIYSSPVVPSSAKLASSGF